MELYNVELFFRTISRGVKRLYCTTYFITCCIYTYRSYRICTINAGWTTDSLDQLCINLHMFVIHHQKFLNRGTNCLPDSLIFKDAMISSERKRKNLSCQLKNCSIMLIHYQECYVVQPWFSHPCFRSSVNELAECDAPVCIFSCKP